MSRRFLIMFAGVAVAAACSDSPVAPSATQPRVSLSTSSSVWEETVLGNTGPGSLYALYKPYGWNGEVVYYAHGFNDVASPVQIPTTQDGAEVLRDALGAMGYAVAMSSFSSNGYDYLDGTRRMHQLRGLVASKFGKPTYNWLAGHSLGAQISQGLLEQHPGQYDGALLMCGVLGGSRAHFRWLGDVRVLFDYMYPGVLPGDVTYFPPNVDPYAVIPPLVMNAVLTDARPLSGLAVLVSMEQTPLAGRNLSEIVQSLITALVWHARGINDVTGRAQGHPAYFNTGVTYSSLNPAIPAAFLALLNATVPRYASPPDAQNWLDRSFEPTGRLSVPVFTLHTRHDQSVPFWHEAIYRKLVTDQGAGGYLVQRTIEDYGHCRFTPAQVLTAFSQLVDWAKNGNKPTP